MRIAFLTPEYPRSGFPDGGLANYLAKVCRLLKDKGHDPVVFLIGEQRGEMDLDGIRVIEVSRPWLGPVLLRGPLSPFRAAYAQREASRRLASALRARHARAPFDVIQASSYQATAAALAGRAPVPLIVRLSSYTPLLREAEGRRTTLADRLTDRQELRAIRCADAVFAPSQFMAEAYAKHERIFPAVIRSPFVAPSVREDPSLYEENLADKPYLLFFGKLNRLKGVDVMADALPPTLAAHPTIHAIFVGRDVPLPGGRPWERIIKEKAGAQRDRFHFPGPQPRERLTPIIRGARLVVLPSRVDNYPNTCLEAQALGKIVVATRNSSLDELIQDGVTGFLCEAGDPASLVRAMDRALSLAAGERERMEAAIRALAATRDPAADVERLLAFYREAMASRSVFG